MCTNNASIRNSIDFILSHFDGQHELFPRTIMTTKTKGQKKIEYETDVQAAKDKIFDYFKEAGFTDCKINAFPYNTEHTGVEFDVKNKTAAIFIMIDLDLRDFDSKEKLDSHLKKTLNKLSLKFHGKATPTVLWTGNGYHIYQPIDGMVFEKYKIFYDFLPFLDNRDLTTEFLRFAEKFFSNGRSDPNHLPSIKSCLVRVPGTINSKNGSEVKVVQRWDGKKPAIQWVNDDFRSYLIQKRIDKIKEKKERRKLSSSYGKTDINKIGWIENLLQTPLDDHRKFCLWRILCPYLVNVRKLSHEDSTTILKEWLQKCDQTNKLNFNLQMEIKHRLRHVGPFLPASKETLKKEYAEICHIFRDKNIFLK